ncbi:SDR family oxidoreductase [Mycobacterium sp. URHB0044]|jgi:NAD(P)-dependent dehydrogenase (short-subunit alcohol dehydrogenase family)|uniref:SDR family NAD(P)-dependent oxidoreductase n=1 Tax=Mycobacterium sp. URHB0044 TaxID=1380386 RepID=UPI00048CC462|nr:SDR family oxidoreductase [Mycobacterium sp. URHB0044]
MNLKDRCAVVTGGGHGIGRALAEELSACGARVVVADLNVERARKVAERIDGLGLHCDVGSQEAVDGLVVRAEREFGPVSVFCSNAGYSDSGDGLAQTPEAVRRVVDVNMFSHVWAAQAVLPGMLDRGEGWLIQTISSAALITGPSFMGYTMSKHGALGFAEWAALNYAHRGIQVTCLCPNAVNTGMLGRNEDDETRSPTAVDLETLGEVVEPEDCARQALDAAARGHFLALPHPRVGQSFLRKATDYDAWLERTNQRLQAMGTVPS